jgi:DtxR family transcriptional regulator, Mn-dependent transcriptional regulator
MTRTARKLAKVEADGNGSGHRAGGAGHGSVTEDGTPKITAATEHYLQSIYALSAERKTLIGARLAQHLRVSPPSVTQTLQRLERDGYVKLVDRGDRKDIVLTDAGRAIGEASTRKHRLIELWLQKELQLSSTQAHEAAEGFEAGFTPLLLERLYESLDHPKTCPHGNPIAGPGRPLEMDYDGCYLDEVQAGDEVTIGRITEEAEADMDLLDYLERHRIFPGVRVTILAKDRLSGAVTARSQAGEEVRIEGRSAALIWVKPVPATEAA